MRLFLHYSKAFYSSHGKTWSDVGMTPFIGQWNALINKHLKMGMSIHGDQSKCDSHQLNVFVETLCHHRWECYPVVERTEATLGPTMQTQKALQELVVLVGRCAVRLDHGTVTGQFITTIRNTWGAAIAIVRTFFSHRTSRVPGRNPRKCCCVTIW
jgi:hypothetical protein